MTLKLRMFGGIIAIAALAACDPVPPVDTSMADDPMMKGDAAMDGDTLAPTPVTDPVVTEPN